MTTPESSKSPLATILRDPLSDVTRQERKWLLGVSMVALFIVKTGLVPTKISALGIEFARSDQNSLLYILALIVLYFLTAFVTYALSDFLAWRLAGVEAAQKQSREIQALSGSAEAIDMRADAIVAIQDVNRMRRLSRLTALVRGLFEFFLPIVVGIYAIVVTLPIGE